MQKFKTQAFTDVAAFVQISADQYGAKIGGTKGNVQLLTFDGRLKIQRNIAERITFDERLNPFLAQAVVLGASKHHGHLLVLIQHLKLLLIHLMFYIVRLFAQEKTSLKLL